MSIFSKEGKETIEENKIEDSKIEDSKIEDSKIEENDQNDVNINDQKSFEEAVKKRNEEANILKELNQSALEELEKAEDSSESTFAPYAIVIGTIVSLSLLTYFINKKNKNTTKESTNDD